MKLVVSNVESSYNLKLDRVANLQDNESIECGDRKFVYAIFSKEECEHPFPLAKIS